MLLTALFYIFIAVVCIQLVYFFLFIKTSTIPQSNEVVQQPVSIIIAARNEAVNLLKNLPFIFKQDYHEFEVIVVNDGSTDITFEVLDQFSNDHHNLKVISVEGSTGNKKNALQKGIENATYELLLFTDADCRPFSNNWIREMAAQFKDQTQIVLGYGAYEKIKGSFLNKLIRYETLLTAIQYFSYAAVGIPYMGVGRNLAYTKSLFNNSGGFDKHQHIKSGDDDLLINEVATPSNTAICISKDSFTISEPKTNFSKWFRQKRRHITTAPQYKFIHKILLGLFYLSQLLFWFLAILLLSFSFKWQLVLVVMAIRFMLQYIIYGMLGKKLNEKDLILFFPILDILLIFTQLALFISNLISKSKTW
jgi:glycosyltransferase involved in cell wall biosynthesis